MDAKVRRTNSCPEMKKTSSISILSVERPLEEKEEEEISEHPTLNGHAMVIIVNKCHHVSTIHFVSYNTVKFFLN